MATYERVLRGLPKYGLGYGNQFTLTAAGTTLVLGRYGP